MNHSVTCMSETTLNRGERMLDEEGGIMDVMRLSEMGLNASLFSHEVKNILSRINVASYLTKKQIKGDNSESILDFLGEVDDGVLQINRLVEDILNNSLTTQNVMESVDVAGLLGRTLGLLAKSFEQNDIVVEKRYGENPLFKVLASETLLTQVFINLFNNAQQAIEEEKGEGRIVIQMARDDDDIEVRIYNSGPSIPDNIMPHIFEPFYTTKEAGKGTGLGLYFVLQTMQRWGGCVTVENCKHEGTIFILRFQDSLPANRL